MPALGAMIEVPAAVYQVKEIGHRVDFMSVGTNDLTQYLLAVDRNNPRVADLYDGLHPSVLRALKSIYEQAEMVNCQLSVCGEMAGDPISAVVLLGLGYENFSMSASSLLRVKSLMLKISREMAESLAAEALCLSNGAEVVDYMSKVLEPHR
jgi:phosphotransferase system enzyme I (PtsP)